MCNGDDDELAVLLSLTTGIIDEGTDDGDGDDDITFDTLLFVLETVGGIIC